ncbi:POLE3 [Cordylochernes scorpioides]|uniref:DNA polymerase epsilon subunit 3 n=1 Tax=Cordylochernes scorpioides TaxID=51811 RepID=A0ABY6K913_9ARAC|nr:POLE3 [Cordylochernes scorpioides]
MNQPKSSSSNSSHRHPSSSFSSSKQLLKERAIQKFRSTHSKILPGGRSNKSKSSPQFGMSDKSEDFKIPKSSIGKLLREKLPPQIIVTAEANSAFSKAAAVFILYTTACANNIAEADSRKILTGTDISNALEQIEVPDIIHELERSIKEFKEEKSFKDALKKKKKSEM